MSQDIQGGGRGRPGGGGGGGGRGRPTQALDFERSSRRARLYEPYLRDEARENLLEDDIKMWGKCFKIGSKP